MRSPGRVPVAAALVAIAAASLGAQDGFKLKSRVESGNVTEVEVYGVPEDTVERLRGLEGVLNVWVEEREQAQVLSVQTRADVQLTAAILGHLNGTSVGRVSHREPTLEDAYVALVTEE